MGIIKQQGLKQSIVIYTAIVIGAINLLIIYPFALTQEEMGVIPFINAWAGMVGPFIMLGGASFVIRFFPHFKNPENGHNGFFPFLLILLGIGFMLFCSIVWLFSPFIQDFFKDESELYLRYLPFVVPVAFFLAIFNITSRYISNFHRIAIPPIFTNLAIKISTPSLIFFYYFDWISFDSVFYGLIGAYSFSLICLFIYLKSLGQLYWRPNLNFIKPDLQQEMLTFGFYGILGTLSSTIAIQIDIIMVGHIIDLSNVAVYSVAFFIAEVIDVPRKSLENIINPLLAEAIRNDDQAKVLELYQKSSLNLFIIGGLLLIGIWTSIDDLFLLMPNGEKFMYGKPVILILGIGILFDQITGVNTFIIGYSKYFRFTFYLVLIMALINIINNYLFIPIFHIYGAALATLISKIVFNFSKSLFIWYKMRLHPFEKAHLVVTALIVGTYIIANQIPSTSIPWLNIIISSAFISVFYIGMLLYFNPSPDVRQFILSFWKKIRT